MTHFPTHVRNAFLEWWIDGGFPEAQTSGSRLAPVVKVDHDGMSW